MLPPFIFFIYCFVDSKFFNSFFISFSLLISNGSNKYGVYTNTARLTVLDGFYSDSISDFPLSLCAQKAFLVVNHGKRVKTWPKISMKTTEKIQKTIL